MSTTEKLKAKFGVEFTSVLLPSAHPRLSHLNIQIQPEQVILPRGHVRSEGRRALPCDLFLDRDNRVLMRDGVQLNVDVFRPTNADKVPAIIAWSPYGKAASLGDLDEFPCGMGVPKNRLTGYQKFEGPDPGDWVDRGYAVVHPDARGSHLSEGSIWFWGQQEAEDIHDTIDWVSRQPWCNGSVCMAGNSWLAVAQLHYASRFSHPALKAIAPWEGFTDLYRQMVVRGGMPSQEAAIQVILKSQAGTKEIEDLPKMIQKYPLFNEYWADKEVAVENIKIPIYSLGSYSSMFHCYGSFDVFRNGGSEHKWLRVHPYYEWYDLYRPESVNDLQRFFDRYCKGIENGWEYDTPRLRLSLVGFGSIPSVIERPETQFPPERVKLRKVYLDGKGKALQHLLPPTESVASHDGNKSESFSDFTLLFDEYTELAGYARVRLWMSCKEADDMDVVVQIRKLSKAGELMRHLNFPVPVTEAEVANVNVAKYLGPQGMLRASHSVSRDDTKTSADGQVLFYKHDRQEKIPEGTIVPVDITLWPMGMVFDKGEGIVLRVSGHDMALPELPMPTLSTPALSTHNHMIHTGGQYDSHIILPYLPLAMNAKGGNET